MLDVDKSARGGDMNDDDLMIEDDGKSHSQYILAPARIAFFIKTICLSFLQVLVGRKLPEENNKNNMGHRSRACEELGPIYLLKSIRDQVELFQEKRGFTQEENNFVNLMAIMVQQAGHAMYAVFTMFLALLPAATILLHVCHFILDRALDIVTTRRQGDLVFKGTVFLLQLVAIFLAIRFVSSAIFYPIMNMQMTILSKMTFMEDPSVGNYFG